MRNLLRFPKLISRPRFQGRSTLRPPIHRLPSPTHRFPLPQPQILPCPYSNCNVNEIWKIYHGRTMKMVNGKLEDFGQRLEDLKSATPPKKTVAGIIRDISVDKFRSILFDFMLANWDSILVYILALLGLTEWAKKLLAAFKDSYVFIKEKVKIIEEMEGKIVELIATLKDLKSRMEKLEKELGSDGHDASTTAGGATTPGA